MAVLLLLRSGKAVGKLALLSCCTAPPLFDAERALEREGRWPQRQAGSQSSHCKTRQTARLVAARTRSILRHHLFYKFVMWGVIFSGRDLGGWASYPLAHSLPYGCLATEQPPKSARRRRCAT